MSDLADLTRRDEPRAPRHRPRRRRGRGAALLLFLVLVVALVVDTSAAYLQRQGLDTLADGAALHGADLGATGLEIFRLITMPLL